MDREHISSKIVWIVSLYPKISAYELTRIFGKTYQNTMKSVDRLVANGIIKEIKKGINTVYVLNEIDEDLGIPPIEERNRRLDDPIFTLKPQRKLRSHEIVYKYICEHPQINICAITDGVDLSYTCVLECIRKLLKQKLIERNIEMERLKYKNGCEVRRKMVKYSARSQNV